MGADGLAALTPGRLFDRHGVIVLALATLLAGAFPLLVFGGSFPLALAGLVLWGIGLGAQESILRAAVAAMVPPTRRGAAYGLFNTGYGLAWFGGSAVMGVLYDVFRPGLLAFSVGMQLLAAGLFLTLRGRLR